MKRKISDVQQDELYNSSITAAPISKPVGQDTMTPRNTIADRLQVGNQGHLPSQPRFRASMRPCLLWNDAQRRHQRIVLDALGLSPRTQAVSISQYGLEHDGMLNNTSPSLVPHNDHQIARENSDDPLEKKAAQEVNSVMQDINYMSIDGAKQLRILQGDRFHSIGCVDNALGNLTSDYRYRELYNRAISVYREAFFVRHFHLPLVERTELWNKQFIWLISIDRDDVAPSKLTSSDNTGSKDYDLITRAISGYRKEFISRYSHLPLIELRGLWMTQAIQFILISRKDYALGKATPLNNSGPDGYRAVE
jgi:hypothetical protein